jgi:16S rRNA C967 or C1407 C5-methylase (RsmB/RsmF family)/NOL1/NOP2/fmu family ribosome biogenesis protein
MQNLPGADWPDFEAALQQPAPVSIRLNPAKPQDGADYSGLNRIFWHPQGYYLPERPVFTLDPALHAGAYYVQEASSMFVYEALRQSADFSRPLKILDLCAAPGGKSTLLAAMLAESHYKGLLVANENIRARIAPLRENLERWGSPNIAVTNAEVEAFAAMESFFDIVLADAPCSGEGLFRKDPDAVREWSAPHVEFCAARQKRILAAAVQALAPGGLLLFSTCTYNSSENDGNAAWLVKTFDLETVRLEIPADWGVFVTDHGYQFFPHRVQGEGFFLAVFRKKGLDAKKTGMPGAFKNLKPLAKNLAPQAARWLSPEANARFFQLASGEVLALPAFWEPEFRYLDQMLKSKWLGVSAGEFKGTDFVPDHALALSAWMSPDWPFVNLDLENALLFLKKETFHLPDNAPKGWVLARYRGLNLGWMKVLPNRLNNYLPQERRIRMALT